MIRNKYPNIHFMKCGMTAMKDISQFHINIKSIENATEAILLLHAGMCLKVKNFGVKNPSNDKVRPKFGNLITS